MKVQNSAPMAASRPKRAPRPRSFAIARARAVSHLGRSSSASDGSGRAPTARASGIQHLHQLARGILAGESQEDLLETLRSRIGAAAELVHRAAGADRSFRDDRHAIAERLRDLE